MCARYWFISIRFCESKQSWTMNVYCWCNCQLFSRHQSSWNRISFVYTTNFEYIQLNSWGYRLPIKTGFYYRIAWNCKLVCGGAFEHSIEIHNSNTDECEIFVGSNISVDTSLKSHFIPQLCIFSSLSLYYLIIVFIIWWFCNVFNVNFWYTAVFLCKDTRICADSTPCSFKWIVILYSCHHCETLKTNIFICTNYSEIQFVCDTN